MDHDHQDSIDDIDDEFYGIPNHQECSACGVSADWFQQLRNENTPYVGCSHCETEPHLWCTQCDKGLTPDSDGIVCTCPTNPNKTQ